MNARKTLTVVFANTHRTYVSIVYENESMPYQRRTVQIELTEEQRKLLEPRNVGESGGEARFEEIERCWLEPLEITPPEATDERE